jgi:hypothetical protein
MPHPTTAFARTNNAACLSLSLLPRLVSVLEAASSSGSVRKQDVEDFRRLAAAARLASQASRCKAAGMAELVAKQRTALLRYVGIVPADKVGGRPCCAEWPRG